MSDYPRFFSKNYVQPSVVDFQKDYDNITVSHGDDLKKFLCDRNLNTQWLSDSGSKDDIYQIDSFDNDPILWTSNSPYVTVTRETSIKHEGSASVKFDFFGSWNGGLAAYRNFASPINLSDYDGRKIWKRAPTVFTGFQNVDLVLSLSANCATLDKKIPFTNLGNADEWYEEVVSSLDLSTLTAVQSLGIYDNSPAGIDDFIVYLDDLRITQEPETIEVQFYEGSSITDRTVDTIVLQNINLKEFKLQYEDSEGDWADVTGASWTTNTNDFIWYEFTAVTTSRMRLILYKTITANQEKKIGEFWLMKHTYSLTDAMDSYSPSTLQNDGSVRLATFEDMLWWTHEKYRATVGLRRIDSTELAVLKAIYDTHEPFVFIPEPEARPEVFYLVHWKSAWAEPYSSQYKGLGFDVSMSLEEV